MSSFYLDSSALAKRSMREVGMPWVMALLDPAARQTIRMSAMTRVEVAAALAARHRAGAMTYLERDQAMSLLLSHYAYEYHALPTAPAILDCAVTLTQMHRLRCYDAVQLETPLVVNQKYTAATLPNLTFVAADTDLLTAARAENLVTANPNDYPS